MFESTLSLLGTTIVALLFGAAALFLLSLLVVMVGCFLGLGTQLCQSVRGWLLHSHR